MIFPRFSNQSGRRRGGVSDSGSGVQPLEQRMKYIQINFDR